ncbi:MAG: GNAT family N-acetyltransferase [Candidatus Hodarchaeales archaeon]
MEKLSVRKATITDIPAIVKLRRIMFESMGDYGEKNLKKSDEASTEYFEKHIPDKVFQGWVVERPNHEIICCGGVVIDTHPPGPLNSSGKIAYIMNICTLPEFRRRGAAGLVLSVILDWVSKKGISKATLHATEDGKSLYEKFKFIDSNEMYLRLPR